MLDQEVAGGRDAVRGSRQPTRAEIVAEKPERANLTLASYVNFPVRNYWRREFNRTSGHVTAAGRLIAVVEHCA